MSIIETKPRTKWYRARILIFFLVMTLGICFWVAPSKADPTYGVASPDIGTFQTPWGNWTFWIGWDANFSETYMPTNETYCWVVYFAPEATYVALQSGKGLYSAVNVTAGIDYFYGGLDLGTSTRLLGTMIKDDLHSITISRNAFNVSSGIPGTGPFSQLSFSLSSGITFLKEKSTDRLLRGFQRSYGLSLALDLIALPLPLSVCLGIDTDADDPPELGQFVGFYPVIIWALPANTSQNPIDLLVSKLESDTTGNPFYPYPNYTKQTEELLLKAVRIVQSAPVFRAFVENAAHDSTIDGLISGAQDWLNSGDTSHLNLPQSLYPPDPRTLTKMRQILPATQMTFETAYSRPAQNHTIYVDCVKTVHCTLGKECRVVVTAQEIADQIPGAKPADLEGLWVGFDTTPEAYITHEQIEWEQIANGEAVHSFVQNTDTPVLLGVLVSRYDLPQSIRDLQDKNLELCRRYALFSIIGDANGDGSTNVQDVICIINVILDTGTASGNPDCNDDGSVNVLDVICVINKILGG